MGKSKAKMGKSKAPPPPSPPPPPPPPAPSKGKAAGKKGGKVAKGAAPQKADSGVDNFTAGVPDECPDTPQSLSLEGVETAFLRKVSIACPEQPSLFSFGGGTKGGKDSASSHLLRDRERVESAIVQRALATLEDYNMCILHNALSQNELAICFS
jgi:hypothetical protein